MTVVVLALIVWRVLRTGTSSSSKATCSKTWIRAKGNAKLKSLSQTHHLRRSQQVCFFRYDNFNVSTILNQQGSSCLFVHISLKKFAPKSPKPAETRRSSRW